MLTYDAMPDLAEIKGNPRFWQFYDVFSRAGRDIRMAGYYAEHAYLQELTEGRTTAHLRKAQKSVNALLAETARLRGLRASPFGSDAEYRALLNTMLDPSAQVIEDVGRHIETAIALLDSAKGLWKPLEAARMSGQLPIEGDLLTEAGPGHLHREMLTSMAVRCDLQLKAMALLLELGARSLSRRPGARFPIPKRGRSFC